MDKRYYVTTTNSGGFGIHPDLNVSRFIAFSMSYKATQYVVYGTTDPDVCMDERGRICTHPPHSPHCVLIVQRGRIFRCDDDEEWRDRKTETMEEAGDEPWKLDGSYPESYVFRWVVDWDNNLVEEGREVTHG